MTIKEIDKRFMELQTDLIYICTLSHVLNEYFPEDRASYDFNTFNNCVCSLELLDKLITKFDNDFDNFGLEVRKLG